MSADDVGKAMDELKVRATFSLGVRLLMVLQDIDTALLFHAELDNGHVHADKSVDPKLYSTFLTSRPTSLETDAISLLISLQSAHPSSSLRAHIVHLSAASALPSIRSARAAGAKLTVETCFHYLVLSSTTLIPDGAPQYKCCPPIRDAKNRDALWEALKDGTIDYVVSDHSPCTPELKLLTSGDIMGAWGGISTLGLGLSLLWTEGRKRVVSMKDILEWYVRAQRGMRSWREGRQRSGWALTRIWLCGILRRSLGCVHSSSAR